MAYITVNGVDHYYEWVTAAGSDGPSGKPVMVYIHGWAGSARYWRSTATALSADFDALLYDMRGFGRSVIQPHQAEEVAARGYALETFADDLAELLGHLGLSSVSINAHSTGASVAVLFLNRFPALANRAILTCNGIFEYNKLAFETFYKFGRLVVAFRPAWLGSIPLMPTLFMGRFLTRPIPATEKAAFLSDFLAADYGTALGTIYTAVSKEATEVMPQEFGQIVQPTLLVSGECDQITPAPLGEQAAALNGHIDYAVIPQTGHFPMLEAPDLYLERVQQFLAAS